MPLARTLAMLLVLLALQPADRLRQGGARHAPALRHVRRVRAAAARRRDARERRSFSLEGESRELTVLFSDVRDFTAVSERLPPRELSAMMNAYLTAMTEAIHATRGTIDKYIGDAIMAFWGAPLADAEHARDAVARALAMRSTMPRARRRSFVAARLARAAHRHRRQHRHDERRRHGLAASARPTRCSATR